MVRINKNAIKIFIMFIFMFEPKLFVKIPIMNNIFIVGMVFSFLIVLVDVFLTKSNISKVTIIMIIYRMSFLLQTILAQGDIMLWGYMSMVLVTLSLMFDCYFKANPQIFLKMIIIVLTSMLTINLIIAYLYPDGVVEQIYYIGIRTRFVDVIFVLITCCLIMDRLNKKKMSVLTIYSFCICIYTIFQFWIATALVGLMIFLVLAILRNNKLVSKLLNIEVVIVGGLIAHLLVVYVNIIQKFDWLIGGILNKSITLSGRTEIWERAKAIIHQRPLFGYGLYENGSFVYWGYRGGKLSYWQAHNQWLQLMHDGGLLTMILFIILILSMSSSLKKCKEKYLVACVMAGVITYIVMMITEIYSYTPYFYLLILLGNKLYIFSEKQ